MIWANLFISTVASTDGNAYLAVGCDEGVWIGTYFDSQCKVCVPVTGMYVPLTQLAFHHSFAPRAVSQDGNAVCDVRRVWNFSRARKQGKAFTCSIGRVVINRIRFEKRFLRTISSFSCRLPEKKTNCTLLTSLATRMLCSFSASEV